MMNMKEQREEMNKVDIIFLGAPICSLRELVEAYEKALQLAHVLLIEVEKTGNSRRCEVFSKRLVEYSKLLGVLNKAGTD